MKYVQPMSLPPTDDDREFEHSPLSGTFSRDGGKVDVEIYRYAGTQEPWRLEVIDLSSGRCTAWLATFATDQEASTPSLQWSKRTAWHRSPRRRAPHPTNLAP